MVSSFFINKKYEYYQIRVIIIPHACNIYCSNHYIIGFHKCLLFLNRLIELNIYILYNQYKYKQLLIN